MTAKECLEKHGITPNKSVKPKGDGPTIEDCELQESIYDEGAGKVSKQMAQNKKVADRVASIVKEQIESKGVSRNDLMLQAKAKGIKNFRILNKSELAEIVGGCDDLRAQAITIDAVNRWKSGFGKRTKAVA